MDDMSTGINGLVDALTPTVSGSQKYKKHPFDDDSDTEDSSCHLEATHNTLHTTQNTLDNLLSNPLAFQVRTSLAHATAAATRLYTWRCADSVGLVVCAHRQPHAAWLVTDPVSALTHR